jgi:cytochrome c-type biogenesis protein CcmH/NrfF
MWDYALWNFHLANLWLIFPEGITLFGTVYIWRWDRKREQAKRQRQAQTELQRLLQQAGGGNKK